MKPLKLLFMGTPEFALPALSALCHSPHTVAAIYTQPPRPAGRGQKERFSPVHNFALENNIPVYTPVTLRDAQVQAEFKQHQADAAIVAAYGLLLPAPILQGTRYGCINIHPSLLPRWRGAAPIQRTLMAGDKETGVVIMQMDEGLDTGDMLKLRVVPVSADANAGVLHDELAGISARLLLEVLSDIQDITPVKQPEAGVTYARKITKEECRIDWQQNAGMLYDQIRALTPSPSAFFIYKGEMVKVFAAEITSSFLHPLAPPGTVMDNDLLVACGEGALRLLTLQRPGKRIMEAREMLKGYGISTGDKLE